MRFLGSTSDEVITRSAESRISNANLGSYINVRQNGYVMNIKIGVPTFSQNAIRMR
jgi:hypothetical protein